MELTPCCSPVTYPMSLQFLNISLLTQVTDILLFLFTCICHRLWLVPLKGHEAYFGGGGCDDDDDEDDDGI